MSFVTHTHLEMDSALYWQRFLDVHEKPLFSKQSHIWFNKPPYGHPRRSLDPRAAGISWGELTQRGNHVRFKQDPLSLYKGLQMAYSRTCI